MATVLTSCCSTFVEAQTATVIPANLPAGHVGEYATLEGVVAKVFTSKSGKHVPQYWRRYPNQTFTDWIPPASPVQVTRKFLSKHYRQEMPAGSVNRKKGIHASVDMGEIKNGDSVSVFIIQVTALS